MGAAFLNKNTTHTTFDEEIKTFLKANYGFDVSADSIQGVYKKYLKDDRDSLTFCYHIGSGQRLHDAIHRITENTGVMYTDSNDFWFLPRHLANWRFLEEWRTEAYFWLDRRLKHQWE